MRRHRGSSAAMHNSRKVLVPLVAMLLAVPAAPAVAAQRTKPRTVAVDVSIDSFGMRHGRPVAHATAHTTAYTRNGSLRQSQQKTTLAVKTAANGCKILTL